MTHLSINDTKEIQLCMTAIFLYTADSEFSSDFHSSILKHKSCKWRWMTNQLRIGIRFLYWHFEWPKELLHRRFIETHNPYYSFEKPDLRLYHGIGRVTLPKWIINNKKICYEMIMSTSTNYNLVKSNFAQNGIIFTLDNSLFTYDENGIQYDSGTVVFMYADVSWISPFPHESERLGLLTMAYTTGLLGVKLLDDPDHIDEDGIQHFVLSRREIQTRQNEETQQTGESHTHTSHVHCIVCLSLFVDVQM